MAETSEKDEKTKEELEPDITIEYDVQSTIIYGIGDSPPIYLTMFFATQQALSSLAGCIILPLLVAEAACALNSGIFIRKLASTTLFLSGFTTVLQVTIGIRLPLYQGPSSSYAVPLIALNKMDSARCDYHQFYGINSSADMNMTTESALQEQLIEVRVREMMGPLILAGLLHALIGATGLVGVLLRFIGPITIVPTILLIGIYIVKPVMKYTESHWGISALVWVVSLILSLYLGHRPMPIPVWTPKKGFRVILISILIGWSVCGIMTYAGAFSSDPNSLSYKARTDARADVIRDTGWFYMPYPGQFGSPLYSLSVTVGFLIATLTSILDSIGDYYATAAMCRVPPPPKHGVNRGIAVEGLCSAISGAFGAGHATTTYGGNIGAIGMTKVASRQVFLIMGLIYMVLGVLAKVSAVFISIPYPVLGGSTITLIGVFVGVNLSNLRVIDLASTRNLSIMGTAVFVGLLVPTWMEKNSKTIKTGSDSFDQIITMLLGNPNFFGGFLACLLDNTVPGTEEERGILAWKHPELTDCATNYLEGDEVYDLPLPDRLKNSSLLKYIPLCSQFGKGQKDIEEKGENYNLEKMEVVQNGKEHRF
ncbi:S23A1-like protein [Mya arenaria]|uniref:S23A1-like protein n=1 Tax=Mya arenaria TaxID=6604 RepID=A0ABY7FJX1_MYAAR|nr:S23A1-like protein [Mya arenaria]